MNQHANSGAVTMRLTYAQISIAAHVATMRRGNNLKRGRQHKHGLRKWTWDIEVNGACAELAVAAYLNLYWDGGTLNEYRERDVGNLVDVRQTDHPTGRLPLHASDPDGVPFVLVISDKDEFRLMGWIFAREGKLQEFWCDPTGTGRPAYFVPASRLHDMATLRDCLAYQLPADAAAATEGAA